MKVVSMATAMIVAMLHAGGVDAVFLDTRSQLNARNQFSFGNLINSAAAGVTEIAGGNDTVANLTNQAASITKAVDSGDASQVVGAAGGAIA